MSKLADLLERAFENKGNKNSYSSGPWSVDFEDRPFETLFWINFKGITVISGNTLDKELNIRNTDNISLNEIIPEIEKALPEYHFNIRVELLIPVDISDHWEKQVDGAEYVETTEEHRPADITDGYGWDEVLFSVPRMEDLKNIVISEHDGTAHKIEDFEMFLGEHGSIKIVPTYFVPVEQRENELHAKDEPLARNDYVGYGRRQDVVLPTEMEIPEGMADEEEISDYLSDVTGYCHKGFNIEYIKPSSLEDKIQLAEARAGTQPKDNSELPIEHER